LGIFFLFSVGEPNGLKGFLLFCCVSFFYFCYCLVFEGFRYCILLNGLNALMFAFGYSILLFIQKEKMKIGWLYSAGMR